MSCCNIVGSLWPIRLISTMAQRFELVMPRDIGGFPHGALHRLSVPHEHVGAIVLFVDEFCVESESDTDGEALAQGSGGHVDKGQAGSGMPFKIRLQGTQFEKVFFGEEAGLG